MSIEALSDESETYRRESPDWNRLGGSAVSTRGDDGVSNLRSWPESPTGEVEDRRSVNWY